MSELPSNLPLGKNSAFPEVYAPEVLASVPRRLARESLGIDGTLFRGHDLWEAPEVAWLDPRGKPCVALGWFVFPADSECLIESKSLKLYLGSLNGGRFDSAAEIEARIARDLSNCAGSAVEVKLTDLGKPCDLTRGRMPGVCIDSEELEIDDYTLCSEHLAGAAAGEVVEETLVTHLFRSRCPVTSQPDWASVAVRYRGPKIARAALLRYWISFRETRSFHEGCVERMFSDIAKYCSPDVLEVEARFGLRGGLAIHPLRKSPAL